MLERCRVWSYDWAENKIAEMKKKRGENYDINDHRKAKKYKEMES